MSETTVRSMRQAYIETLRKNRGDGEVMTQPTKPRGRPVLLGKHLDTKVQMYLRKVREGGGAISSRIASAAAHGILLKQN